MSVFIWGKGDSGRTGLGEAHKKDVLEPTSLDAFRGNIVDVSSGEGHALAVNELGDVYVWGRGKDGQHGDGKKLKAAHAPTKILALEAERVVGVVCGPFHCLAITKEGEVYEWGMLHRFEKDGKEHFGAMVEMHGMTTEDTRDEWEKKRSQMIERSHKQFLDAEERTEGMNFSNFVTHLQTTPLLVPGLEKVKVVSASSGYAFNVAVTGEGHVYGWGFNEKTQLGIGHRYNQETPQLVKALLHEKVIQASCGQQHVVAVSEDGKVYSWGMGVFGQLGHGDVEDQRLPKVISSLSPYKVIQVACGYNHSLALTEDGKVYTWGSSEYGQQAGKNDYTDWQEGDQHSAGRRRNYFTEPRQIPTDAFNNHKVIKLSCGAMHNCAITETGDVFTWGWGISGVLGHGDRRLQIYPRIITNLKGEKIINISASLHLTIAVTASASTTWASDFLPVFSKSLFTDIEFLVQGKVVKAHKAIIYARCPALWQEIVDVQKKIEERKKNPPPVEPPKEPTLEVIEETQINELEGGSSSSEETPEAKKADPVPEVVNIAENGTVVLVNVEYFVFGSFLRYLYTDQLKAATYHMSKILALAKKYELARLQKIATRLQLIESEDEARLLIPPSHFAKDFAKLLNHPDNSDIQFSLSDREIYAHRSILYSRSDYFKTSFEGNFVESSLSKISMKEIDGQTFLALIHFMYTDEIGENAEQMVPVLMAAGRFLLDDLKQKIEKHLENQLDYTNVIDLLMLSEAAQTPKLRKSCVSLLVDNLPLILNTNKPALVEFKHNSPTTYRHIEFLYRKKHDPNFVL